MQGSLPLTRVPFSREQGPLLPQQNPAADSPECLPPVKLTCPSEHGQQGVPGGLQGRAHLVHKIIGKHIIKHDILAGMCYKA